MGVMGDFYRTNFGNGEFWKHKWAYAGFFALGAAVVQYDGCAQADRAYHTLENKVEHIYHIVKK